MPDRCPGLHRGRRRLPRGELECELPPLWGPSGSDECWTQRFPLVCGQNNARLPLNQTHPPGSPVRLASCVSRTGVLSPVSPRHLLHQQTRWTGHVLQQLEAIPQEWARRASECAQSQRWGLDATLWLVRFDLCPGDHLLIALRVSGRSPRFLNSRTWLSTRLGATLTPRPWHQCQLLAPLSWHAPRLSRAGQPAAAPA